MKKINLFQVFLVFLFLTQPHYAQWQLNGVALSDTISDQAVGSIVRDGGGGAFVLWTDTRSGWDIYGQHVDAEGNFYWEKQGRPLVQGPGLQFAPRAVSDGEGGFVMRWHDTRNDGSRDVYAQRFNFSGEPLWELDGVPIIVKPYDQTPVGITQTSDDNYIIGWQDDRNHPAPSVIYAQKISPIGDILWTTDGIVVSSRTGFPEIIPDLNRGAILTWASWDGTHQLYAQRLNHMGDPLWGINGIVAATDFADWLYTTKITVCSDSANGVIIGWDFAKDDVFNAFIQRVDSFGIRLWGNIGIQLGITGNQQFSPQVGMLNRKRVICVWYDFTRLYIQKFDLQGNPLFPQPGFKINNYWAGSEFDMLINHEREILISNVKIVGTNPEENHIFAHKVDSSGQILWDSSGAAISQETFHPFNSTEIVITTDMDGGAIISWTDYRDRFNTGIDCYAQRVYSDGHVGGDTTTSIVTDYIEIPKEGIYINSVYPNPFNHNVTLAFTAQKSEKLEIQIYNIQGQKIHTLARQVFNAGRHNISWNGETRTGKEVSSGIYFIVIQWREFKLARKALLLK